ncbi:hypothetical protein DFH06DRAFT_710147 [Mycena polygramma]|nr:hypothetical protein DFH06DRAFT_710147 [Mycena polygramma]
MRTIRFNSQDIQRNVTVLRLTHSAQLTQRRPLWLRLWTDQHETPAPQVGTGTPCSRCRTTSHGVHGPSGSRRFGAPLPRPIAAAPILLPTAAALCTSRSPFISPGRSALAGAMRGALLFLGVPLPRTQQMGSASASANGKCVLVPEHHRQPTRRLAAPSLSAEMRVRAIHKLGRRGGRARGAGVASTTGSRRVISFLLLPLLRYLCHPPHRPRYRCYQPLRLTRRQRGPAMPALISSSKSRSPGDAEERARERHGAHEGRGRAEEHQRVRRPPLVFLLALAKEKCLQSKPLSTRASARKCWP